MIFTTAYGFVALSSRADGGVPDVDGDEVGPPEVLRDLEDMAFADGATAATFWSQKQENWSVWWRRLSDFPQGETTSSVCVCCAGS